MTIVHFFLRRNNGYHPVYKQYHRVCINQEKLVLSQFIEAIPKIGTISSFKVFESVMPRRNLDVLKHSAVLHESLVYP